MRVELDAVARELHERLLQRSDLRRELVQRDPGVASEVADLADRQPGHRERAVRLLPGLAAVLGDCAGELLRRGRAHADEALRAALDELLHRGVRDQPPASDHDEVVGGEGHLAHQMARDEDRAALRGERAQKVSDPSDPLRIEPVDGLVEQHHPRVAKQRAGDPQPLAHSQREATGPLAGHGAKAHSLDDLLHAAAGDAVALRERQQVVVGRAPAVNGLRVEQRAHLEQRSAMQPVGPSVDRDRAAGRPVQAHDHAHRRGLARPVGPQEARHPAGHDVKGHVVHRDGVAKALGQAADLDHCGNAVAATCGSHQADI